ncbi:MAG: hypothetical protein MK035_08135 [Dehalococcoidia bacterium]|nr:hypothetical protein [Dehalococcoidia bacterium]
MENIINMSDMGFVFEITDSMRIDRENVSVPLEKSGIGYVQTLPDGTVEIIIPESISMEEWQETLKINLESLGYTTDIT